MMLQVIAYHKMFSSVGCQTTLNFPLGFPCLCSMKTLDELLLENGIQTSQPEVPPAAHEPAKTMATVPSELLDATTLVPLLVPAARQTISTRCP